MTRRYWKDQELQPGFEYARKLTRVYAKSFYFSARFLPLPRRWATYALYGFCRYADNLVDIPRGRSRDELLLDLDYLQDEIGRAYRTGDSSHPVVQPFIKVAKRYNIPMNYPMELLQGVRMDIDFKEYKTFDELYVFCYRVAGVVGLMMTHLLGYQNQDAFPYAEKLGVAMQLTNILRDIQEDKTMGRIYLPTDELQKFKVKREDIMSERLTLELTRLLQFQVDRAEDYYTQAEAGVALLSQESRFSIYTASRIYRGILSRFKKRHYNPFLGRIYVPTSTKMSILLSELMRGYVKGLSEKSRSGSA